jgi:hypothetical protein
MNKIHINPFPERAWMKIAALLALLVTGFTSKAQQGSSGNTYIFGGAEMTFFGAHDFVNGGNGALPGIIGTVRGPSSMGILNFASTASQTGASDAAHVDGYVRKYGSTQFVFPVGDNSFYGPFAASGDGTTGAYYHGDPSVAITSDLGGGNYPVLPAGGPFPVATFEIALESVSPIEYWDIDGSSLTPLTLTWDAGSDISTLTGGQLSKLTIAGWNGTEWVAIPSLIDAASILGGTSDLVAGSITTTASIAPDTYTAYTFASRDTPLPVTLASFVVVREGSTALLAWSTTEETNSDRFEIERSRNGDNWKTIGTVESIGDNKALTSYHFVDASLAPGDENLYRLRMVDNDGTFTYSRIRSVRFESPDDRFVYPNPVSDRLFIRNFTRILSTRILDMNGRTVTRPDDLSDGVVNVSKLTTGIYIAEITWSDGHTTSQRILIRK